MKFASTVIMGLFVADKVAAFVPHSQLASRTHSKPNFRPLIAMAVGDMPPPVKSVDVPVIQSSGYGPTDVRYSDFLKLVNADLIEKVTFSSDGTQLLGVDVNGVRLKIEALPNDPTLLTELTEHKVCIEDDF